MIQNGKLLEKSKVSNRFSLISATLENISNCLPYDDQSRIFITDKKLFRYLILCTPITIRTVDLIIDAVLFKHQADLKMYKLMYSAIAFIFRIEPMREKKKPMARKRVSVMPNDDL